MKLEIFDIFTGFFEKKCYTAPVKGRFQNLMNNKTMMGTSRMTDSSGNGAPPRRKS